jgi:putative ABC transport system permease protein
MSVLDSDLMWFDDLRFAVRQLRRRAGVSTLVVTILALGLGANAAIVSVANALLWRPLPFPNGDRLVVIRSDVAGAPGKVSIREYRSLLTDARLFEAVAPFYPTQYNLAQQGTTPEAVTGTTTTSNMLRALGVEPVIGAMWPTSLDLTRQYTVVLGHGLWRRAFGGDPSIVGKSVRLDGYDYHVVGIAPEGADFPERTDVYRAMTEYNADDARRMLLLGLVRRGVTLEQVRAELESLSGGLARTYPDSNTGVSLHADTLRDAVIGDSRPFMWLLIGGALVVLTLTCANAGGLMLARALDRQGDLSVRLALGASQTRLLRELVIEHVLLGLGGSLLALALAHGILGVLLSQFEFKLPAWMSVHLSWPIALGTVIAGLVCGAFSAIPPAARLVRAPAVDGLKSAGRSAGAGSATRVQRWLVVGQVALTMLLLATAGLLARSVGRLLDAPMGFVAQNVFTLRVDPPWVRYPDAATTSEFYRRVTDEIRQLPGVTAAAINQNLPLATLPDAVSRTFFVEGQPARRRSEQPFAVVQQVGPGYFETMRIRFRQGRDISAHDLADSMPVAVVGVRLAAQFWPNADPIGKRLRLEGTALRSGGAGPLSPTIDMPWLTVVGVVDDVRHEHVRANPGFDVYLPYTQAFTGDAYIVVRSTLPAETLARVVPAAVRRVDPEQSVFASRAMTAIVDQTIWQARLTGTLGLGFALLALALATAGLHAIVSQSVSRRTREMGLRLAIGATPHDVRGLIARETFRLVVPGLALGLAASLVVGRAAASLLYDVSAWDPPTFLAAAVFLGIAAAAAAASPAVRASRVDPLTALRQS